MAFTKIVSPGIDTTGSYTVQELNTVGVATAGTVQVGSATTIHTTGIDLGSGNITSHNINSTGIITATSFVGPVTGNITGDITATSGTFSGNVSIAGTLTYEDVTNIDSVGIITARSDVSIADKIIHTGDTNTALRFPADDTVTVETGGSERLRIASDGKVGIGTDNPGDKLSIYTAPNALVFGAKDTTRGNHIFQLLANNPAGDGELRLYKSSATGTHEKTVEIKSTGNSYFTGGSVGIGTDSPSNFLHVKNYTNTSNYITAENTTNGNAGVRLKNSQGDYAIFANDDLIFYDLENDAERLRINSSGLMIFPDVAADKIQLNGEVANYYRISKLAGGGTLGDGEFKFTAGNTSAGGFTFHSGGTERLRITAAGSVGIGTNDPDELLEVGDGTVSGALKVSGQSSSVTSDGLTVDWESSSNSTRIFSEPSSGGSSAIRFFTTNSGSRAEALRITSDGKMGVGCTPETDFQVRNGDGGLLKIGGSGNSATGFQIQYNNSGNTTTEILTNYRATSSNASLKIDTGTFKIATGTSGQDKLIIDSNGRILKGMTASLLGSSDVQLQGSGGPATVAGYKSDNNPAANNSMLTVTGYSQSGSTFTGMGEIDFRVDQGSNTASGYHPGSIVMRVNGGSTSGTHAGLAYSYAGLHDRERITKKSKRYYSLPEWYSGSDAYNTFREEWDYQHFVGYNQYSWYRFTHHSGSSSRGGSVDIRVTWSTRHAAGSGYGHWAFHWRENHSNGYMEIGNVYKYHLNYLSGSFYGWSSSPQLDVYEINDNGNVGGFYLRVQGHVQANSSTYDGGAMHQFLISAHTNRYGADVNKFEFVGNSTPSDVGSIQGNVNLP